MGCTVAGIGQPEFETQPKQHGGSVYPGQYAGMGLFRSFTIYDTSETAEETLKLGCQKEIGCYELI